MIKVGDALPELSLYNQNNERLSLRSWIGKKYLVLFFYPKDFTPGCIKESCAFRDEYTDIVKLGAEVVGISNDSVDLHRKFSQFFHLPYHLLADTEKKAARLFGVQTGFLGLLPSRVTYIADTEGIIRLKVASPVADVHIYKVKEYFTSNNLVAPQPNTEG